MKGYDRLKLPFKRYNSVLDNVPGFRVKLVRQCQYLSITVLMDSFTNGHLFKLKTEFSHVRIKPVMANASC